MNNSQKLLIKLLSTAIHIRYSNESDFKITDYRTIFDEAVAHCVQTLLYPLINTHFKRCNFNNIKIISAWEKDALLNGLIQMQHMHQMCRVLDLLNKASIDVIVLKGLVLRELYPRPELRTMADADLLIHEKDVAKAKKLLSEKDYIEEDNTPMHTRFTHRNKLTIELHWKLTDERYLDKNRDIEDAVWNDALPYQLGGISCLRLSSEDQVLHLLLHMATHLVSSGFGLRQLCDFVLLWEKEGDNIDQESLNQKIKLCGIKKLSDSIFYVCEKLFGIKIPIAEMAWKDNWHIDMLIDDILSGGVYGKRNLALMYGNEFAQRPRNLDNKKRLNYVRRLLFVLFPPIQILTETYSYTGKSTFLIPIAWFQHLLSGVTNKKYSYYDKLKFLFCTNSISRKRARLLRWLEL